MSNYISNTKKITGLSHIFSLLVQVRMDLEIPIQISNLYKALVI